MTQSKGILSLLDDDDDEEDVEDAGPALPGPVIQTYA